MKDGTALSAPSGEESVTEIYESESREQSLHERKGSRSNRDDLKKSSFETYSPTIMRLTDLSFSKEQAFSESPRHKSRNGIADLTNSRLMVLVRLQIS